MPRFCTYRTLKSRLTARQTPLQQHRAIRLLQNFEKPSPHLTGKEVLRIYFSDQQPKLRELLVEELVESLYHHEMEPIHLDLDDLDNVEGILGNLMETHKRFVKDKESFFNKFTIRSGKEKARWEDSMMFQVMIIVPGHDATAESILGKRNASEVD